MITLFCKCHLIKLIIPPINFHKQRLTREMVKKTGPKRKRATTTTKKQHPPKRKTKQNKKPTSTIKRKTKVWFNILCVGNLFTRDSVEENISNEEVINSDISRLKNTSASTESLHINGKAIKLCTTSEDETNKCQFLECTTRRMHMEVKDNKCTSIHLQRSRSVPERYLSCWVRLEMHAATGARVGVGVGWG